MAWQAKLNAPVTFQQEKIVASFDFYDDTAPTTVLGSQVFVFDPNWSNADMQAAIQTAGARLRTAHDRAALLAQSFPTGTTISIP